MNCIQCINREFANLEKLLKDHVKAANVNFNTSL